MLRLIGPFCFGGFNSLDGLLCVLYSRNKTKEDKFADHLSIGSVPD